MAAECKHGLRHGCAYCHGTTRAPATPPVPRKRGTSTRMSEKMNDRMTELKKRLKQIRGE
jgi:histone acetyltransferase (RNA polymerase elongator complex component)